MGSSCFIVNYNNDGLEGTSVRLRRVFADCAVRQRSGRSEHHTDNDSVKCNSYVADGGEQSLIMWSDTSPNIFLLGSCAPIGLQCAILV